MKFKNKTGKIQSFYYNGETIEMSPNYLFDSQLCPSGVGFEEAPLVMVEISDAETIILQRTFGLGDCLMLAPVVDELKEKCAELGLGEKRFILATTRPEFRGKIIQMLSPGTFDTFIGGSDLWRYKSDLGIYLDYYIEQDHTVAKYKDMHRVDMYREFFDILPMGQSPLWGRFKGKGDRSDFIVVQEAGTRTLKGFSKETYEYVVAGLSKDYPVVGLLRDSRVTPEEFVTLIAKARALVCFDSAPLWVSHYTYTPTICILGPSRAEQRLKYHPLSGTGMVKEVNLAKMIGCEPCFESMGTCCGTAKCMDVPKEVILETLETSISEVTK